MHIYLVICGKDKKKLLSPGKPKPCFKNPSFMLKSSFLLCGSTCHIVRNWLISTVENQSHIINSQHSQTHIAGCHKSCLVFCFLPVITGQYRNGVISARTRIDVLVESFRKKQPFTHFLSFALNQPAIQEKFLQFKKEVLEKCSNVSCNDGIRNTVIGWRFCFVLEQLESCNGV